MTDRRKPKIQIGRRKTDVPVKILEQFKSEMLLHVGEAIKESNKSNLTTEAFNLYVTDDKAWKTANEPALENMKNLTNSSLFIVKIISVFGGIAIAITAIKSLFHK